MASDCRKPGGAGRCHHPVDGCSSCRYGDAGSTTREGDDPAFRLHYLGLLGLISEASPWVDEDTRDSMHSALEEAMSFDPAMRVRRVFDRFIISHADQSGEGA